MTIEQPTMQSGKYKGTTFEELLTNFNYFPYVNFLLLGAPDKQTKQMTNDRISFSKYFLDKSLERGHPDKLTLIDRIAWFQLDNYKDNYVFKFGKHKGIYLKHIINTDTGYIKWLATLNEQNDDKEPIYKVEGRIFSLLADSENVSELARQ